MYPGMQMRVIAELMELISKTDQEMLLQFELDFSSA